MKVDNYNTLANSDGYRERTLAIEEIINLMREGREIEIMK